MQFTFPYVLFGLTAILIPIVLHLFNLWQFKKIYFSNVNFLLSLKKENEKKSKLKNLIILLFRIFTIIALVLAFSKPFLSNNSNISTTKSDKKNIILYVDNSFSMNGLSEKGKCIDLAKQKAMEIVNAFGYNDLYYIATNDFEVKHQFEYTKDDVLQAIIDIEITPNTLKLNELSIKINELIRKNKQYPTYLYVISDLQQNIFDIQNNTFEDLSTVFFIPIEQKATNNVSIDTAWIENPLILKSQNNKLFIKIRNYGENEIQKLPITLSINNQQKGFATIDLQKQEEKIITFDITANKKIINKGTIKIIDNPITFDDNFYFVYNTIDKISVLNIFQDNKNQYIQSIFKSDSSFYFESMNYNNIVYSQFSKFNTVLADNISDLNDAFINNIVEFINQGGTFILVPSAKIDIDSYNDLCRKLNSGIITSVDTSKYFIKNIENNSQFYKDVIDEIPQNADLPYINLHYRIQETTNSNNLIFLQNNDVLFSHKKQGQGNFYFITTPLNKTFGNFYKHPLQVISLYKASLQSLTSLQQTFQISKNINIPISSENSNRELRFNIKNEKQSIDIIPNAYTNNNSINLNIKEHLINDGFYDIFNKDKQFSSVAFNYTRDESNLIFVNINKIKEMFQNKKINISYLSSNQSNNITQQIKDQTLGVQLWKWFIIFALIFILLEILTIKFYK